MLCMRTTYVAGCNTHDRGCSADAFGIADSAGRLCCSPSCGHYDAVYKLWVMLLLVLMCRRPLQRWGVLRGNKDRACALGCVAPAAHCQPDASFKTWSSTLITADGAGGICSA